MQGANVVHSADDRRRVDADAEQKSRTTFDKFLGKPEPALMVPKLTFEGDNPKHKFENPTHVTVAILPNLQITQAVEGAKQAAQTQTATKRSSFETGNYSDTAQGQEDAFNDVVNPSRHNKKKP